METTLTSSRMLFFNGLVMGRSHSHGLQMVYGRKGNMKAEVILGYGIRKVNNAYLV